MTGLQASINIADLYMNYFTYEEPARNLHSFVPFVSLVFNEVDTMSFT